MDPDEEYDVYVADLGAAVIGAVLDAADELDLLAFSGLVKSLREIGGGPGVSEAIDEEPW